MSSPRQKKPHPLRLTFILLVIVATYYVLSRSPFLFAPALAFVTTVAVLFFIVRAVLRRKFPKKFKNEEELEPRL